MIKEVSIATSHYALLAERINLLEKHLSSAKKTKADKPAAKQNLLK